jgi:hypothetical protein
MKKNSWLTIGIVLALAMGMLWAGPSMAQMRGKGQWGQGGQGWGCGQGQGQGQGMGYGAASGTCPNYQGYQNSQGNWSWSNTPQLNTGGRGNQGGGRNYQPNTQPGAPNVTQ